MDKETGSHVFLVILLLIAASGCLNNLSDASRYSDEYANELQYNTVSNPEEMCKYGSCSCFVCKNGTALFGLFTSFVGGNCYFHNPCDEETFNNFNGGDSEYQMRRFMLGTGTSFADFVGANSYCNDKLTMAVHWLTGGEHRPYDLPDIGRTMCMLDKGVMPVYVLYSNSENIDITRSGEIGHLLGHEAREITMGRICGPVGPVIVTTEFEYNISKPGVIDSVVEQINAINEECNDYSDPDNPVINCFVAVAPKMGDREALDAVMNHPGLRYKPSLLAFGINSHYSNYTTCSGARLQEEAVRFARYGLYNHSLPTVIPSILFDSGITITDANGVCVWDEARVQDGYGSFFPNGIMSLRGAGVIGIAPYDFNSSASGSDPLKCSDCALGISEARLASWYAKCQDFLALGETRSSGQMPIIFPNESGGYCDYGLEIDAVTNMFKEAQGAEFYEIQTHTLEPQDTELFRCDACLSQGYKKPSDYFPVLATEDFVPKGPLDLTEVCAFEGIECPNEPGNPAVCYIYPELDYYASKFSVDPMLLRAVVWKESSFNRCSTAKVCKPGYSPPSEPKEAGCLIGNYETGYNYLYDPDDKCQEFLDTLMDASGVYNIEGDDPKPKFRFAAMGLLQTMESPYTYWPAAYQEDGQDGQYVDLFMYAKARNRTENVWGAKACSDTFNPFNISDSACNGAAKLQGSIREQREWVDNNGDTSCTDLFEIKEDTSKRDMLAAFAAMFVLAGVQTRGYDTECRGETPLDCWARKYCDTKICKSRSPSDSGGCGLISKCTESGGECVPTESDTAACKDRTDFLSFSYCIINQHGDVKEKLSIYAGFNKLGIYEYLQQNCPTYCPPWDRINKSGVIANPDFDAEDPYSIYGEAGICSD